MIAFGELLVMLTCINVRAIVFAGQWCYAKAPEATSRFKHSG